MTQALLSCYLVGIIWMVQRLVYPAFALVEDADWQRYHQHHLHAITPLVGPAMIGQLALAVWWCFVGSWPSWLNLALVLGGWIITFAWAVPLHQSLEQGHRSAITALVTVNWWRTALWSLQAVLLTSILVRDRLWAET